MIEEWWVETFTIKNLRILHPCEAILCFHSRGQHLCKFIGTKESVYISKDSTPTRLVWDTTMDPWRHMKTHNIFARLKRVSFKLGKFTYFKEFVRLLSSDFLWLLLIKKRGSVIDNWNISKASESISFPFYFSQLTPFWVTSPVVWNQWLELSEET